MIPRRHERTRVLPPELDAEYPPREHHGSQLWWVHVETADAVHIEKIVTYQYIVHAPNPTEAETRARTFYRDDPLAMLPIRLVVVSPWRRGDVLPWSYQIEPRGTPPSPRPDGK